MVVSVARSNRSSTLAQPSGARGYSGTPGPKIDTGDAPSGRKPWSVPCGGTNAHRVTAEGAGAYPPTLGTEPTLERRD